MTGAQELKKLKKDLDDLASKILKKDSQIKKKDQIIEEKDLKIKQKDQIIEEKEQKIEDYYSQIQRLQADFDNYKKRSEKDQKEYIRYANENLILKIIETYEDLGRALQSGKSQDLQEGVEMIYKKLKTTLEGEGLHEICAEGEKFDPFKHEALMVEDHDDYENGTIIEELGKGYTLDSKVIKYSKVKVCKKR
ncbi:MAG: heat shock protein GrpE [Methanobacterium sp. PtaU1.Bin242]|nr:MAG: heat shock protein GrpE [Methanobacterium sp. PtaU1.Bin242]